MNKMLQFTRAKDSISLDSYNAALVHFKTYFGLYDTSFELLPDPEDPENKNQELFSSVEGVTDILFELSGSALRYISSSLYTISLRLFESLRTSTEQTFLNYATTLHTWKDRIWKNLRQVDGNKFDEQVINVMPYNVMTKQLKAIETIHTALSSVSAIYDKDVKKNSDDFLTPECNTAISALENAGYIIDDLDVMKNISAPYLKARVKQSIYLHKYTIKNVLTILDRFGKVARYSDSKYIDKLEDKFGVCIDKLQAYEETTATSDTLSKDEIDDRKHITKARTARLWWYAQFIKAAYTMSNDIYNDFKKLSLAVERSIATPSSN